MRRDQGSFIYTRRDVVEQFRTAGISPVEAMVMLRCRDDLSGRAILDVGIGGGRLARVIEPVSSAYVGLDRFFSMLSAASEEIPTGVRLVQGDLRDLPFASSSFDTCLIMWNTLDILGPEDRLAALARVRLILRPGGLLLYSSQNRHWHHLDRRPRFRPGRNPLTALRRFGEFVGARRRWRSMRHLECSCDEYAMCVQPDHGFRMLHFFSDRDAQKRQLAASGFNLEEAFDESCRAIPEGDRAPHSGTIHYIARRLPRAESEA
jgi:SAM-dependent methyltransferase